MPAIRTILVAIYALLPVVFVSLNIWSSLPAPNASRWPQFGFVGEAVPEVGRALPSRFSRLDLAGLKSSVDRLPATALMRQTGNSIRIAAGQRLSWCIWGGREPLTLFHSVELWASEGLAAGGNRAVVTGAAATIRKYARQLRAEGWTLVVVPVPTKLSVYRDRCRWPVWEKDALSDFPVAADRAPEVYQELLRQLRDDDIAAVDLQTIYEEYRARHPDAILYPPGETHWSGLGIELAAAATADLVSSRTGIARRHFRPSYLEVDAIGDICSGFNPLPSWPSRLAPVYRYHDRLVNGEEGRGFVYAAKPTSLLVAVGTSYTGQYTWLTGQPVGFAWVVGNGLDQCEFHNAAQAGRGSFAAFEQFWGDRNNTVADFSQRQHLATFAKVVVWEFPLRDLASLQNQ